jgi:Sulfotransferase family
LRAVIVHYHIFKNAGSSIDRLLQMAFGSGWATLEGPTPTSLLRPHDLSVFIKDHPEIVAVSSHLLRPPAPPDVRVLPVVLIRHPLDRAFSVYSHLRRHHDETSTETIAPQTSFSQFVLWCLNNKTLGGMVIANYQVIHLSPASFRNGHIYQAVATEDDLKRAIQYLSDGTSFGTVDLFDAAMCRIRQAATAIDLHIPAATVVENTTPGRLEELDERLHAARQMLGPDLDQRYRNENELDYRLYEWAHCEVGSQATPSATSHP